MTDSETDPTLEPDWDAPIKVQLTPAAIIHTLFPSADGVHTGWSPASITASCSRRRPRWTT